MDPVIKALIDEAEGLPSKGDNWGEFLKDLKESTFDSEGSYSQGEPSSVTRFISLEYEGVVNRNKVSLGKIYRLWDDHYQLEQAKRVRQQYLDATVEVVYFSKSGRPGKSERLPKEEAKKPWKPGCSIEEENVRIEGRGFDRDMGPSFVLKSTPIGTETPKGTVVAKRRLGGKMQYLIKPRGASAEKKYLAREELEDLRSRLRNLSYMDMLEPDDAERIQARIRELEKRV